MFCSAVFNIAMHYEITNSRVACLTAAIFGERNRQATQTQGIEFMTVAYTDIVGFNQSTFDTLVKSNTAAAEGVQKLTKHLVNYSSKSSKT